MFARQDAASGIRKRMDAQFQSLRKETDTQFHSLRKGNDANHRSLLATISEFKANTEAVSLREVASLRERVAILESQRTNKAA